MRTSDEMEFLARASNAGTSSAEIAVVVVMVISRTQMRHRGNHQRTWTFAEVKQAEGALSGRTLRSSAAAELTGRESASKLLKLCAGVAHR